MYEYNQKYDDQIENTYASASKHEMCMDVGVYMGMDVYMDMDMYMDVGM